MKNEKSIEALDAYLEQKRNPNAIVKPKVEPKTEKEKKGIKALDKYLEESKPLNQ